MESLNHSVEVDDWDRHWTQFGAAAEMGPTPKYRRRLIFRLLELDRTEAPVEMLEIGSGQGEFAKEYCARSPRAVFVGLELSATGTRIASQLVPSAVFLQRDLLKTVQPDDVPPGFRATHSVCSEVLEHLDDPAALLRNASRYMRPGCRLVVTVPGGPMPAFYRHIGHRKHYSKSELKRVLEAAGFEVERLYAPGFPFFNLFRMVLSIRGQALVGDISGEPGLLVRIGMTIFDKLFYLNFMQWGWQTMALARLSAGADPRKT